MTLIEMIRQEAAECEASGALGERAVDAWEAIERAPESERERIAIAYYIACGREFKFYRSEMARHPLLTEKRLSPAYPLATLEQQAKIVLGFAPKDIFPNLTAHEAHIALSRGCLTEVYYLLDEVGDEAFYCDPPDERLAAHLRATRRLHPKTSVVEVAQWVLACWRDPARRAALLRERIRHDTGESLGRYMERLDELRAEDLAHGPRTGVDAAFKSVAARQEAERQERTQKRLEELGGKTEGAAPSWWKPTRYARILLTLTDLEKESEEMNHCVETYYEQVVAGESVIVALAVPGEKGIERSTAEFTEDLFLVQHMGKGNSKPTPLCHKALHAYMEKVWNPAYREWLNQRDLAPAEAS